MQLFLSPDFNIRSLRKKPKSAAQKIKELKEKLQAHNLTNIGRVHESFIPASLFDQHRPKTSRRRIYSLENTFWGFFLQTCSPIVVASQLFINFEFLKEATNPSCQHLLQRIAKQESVYQLNYYRAYLLIQRN